MNMYRYFKRIFDIIFALIVFIAVLPIFAIFVFLLFVYKKKSGIFFLQVRPGKNEKVFKVIKLKTMTDEKDKEGNLLSDEMRLTKIGEFIRKTSIDEIPQLINVLKGDMSLIGPRPLLVEYLHLYNDHQKRRHEVRPGITGWAQVNGRNAISWKEKFDLDVWYIDHISFKLDLIILYKTIIKVFKKEGISSDLSVTTEKFTGNE